MSAYVSIRHPAQHSRRHLLDKRVAEGCEKDGVVVSIRQHASAYVSIRHLLDKRVAEGCEKDGVVVAAGGRKGDGGRRSF